MANPSLLLAIFFAALYVQGGLSTTFTVKNNCAKTIWPGVQTNPNVPAFPSTGFQLAASASKSMNAPATWAGRMWGRTGCSTDSSGKFTCQTGDCGSGQVACNGKGGTPPASLVEFTLKGDGGKDNYDISLVDGFNLPVSITPQGVSGCTAPSCSANINAVCPAVLQDKVSGSVVGCKSACLEFNQPKYCCTGAYNTSATCKPTTYSEFFKKECPQAYSYAYDDKTSLFTCTGANYLITFCP
ncbi:thaumatin-like protein 1b [Phoenix dactylifera]|uniref:Thaumatin-like protein 1b n=1 Tax=Phoenix dactylifera TaxID=42345 RepID=A0A8B8ZJI3_PHODC|nr:thaumatin-like protein 1b [Phoenix dactylifera]